MDYQQLIPNDISINNLDNYPSNYQFLAEANPNFAPQLFQDYLPEYGQRFEPARPSDLGISPYGLLYDLVAPYITAAQNWWNGIPVNMPYAGQMNAAGQIMQQPTRGQQFLRDNWLGNQIQYILDRDAMY